MQQPTNPMQKEEWEDMFEDKFRHVFNVGVVPDSITKESIKSFISTQISLAKSQERQRIVEIIKDFHTRNILNKDVDRVCTDLITALTEQK